jgi:hypothetical protein
VLADRTWRGRNSHFACETGAAQVSLFKVESRLEIEQQPLVVAKACDLVTE